VTLALPPFTPMIRRILWTLGIVFAVQVVLRFVAPGVAEGLIDVFGLSPEFRVRPDAPPIALWQLVTYSLLHGGFWHVVLNGLGIWMFGGDVERVLGSRGFLRYFVICVIGGALAVVVGGLLTEGRAQVIGASGGVLGLVLAFAMFFPERQVFIFPIPFPLPAWVMAAIYALLNLYGALTPESSGISYAAHLGGLAAGYLYLKGFIKPGSWWSVLRRKKKHPFRVIPGRRAGPYDIN
jgi:membrane associated rhomboid family serine protease